MDLEPTSSDPTPESQEFAEKKVPNPKILKKQKMKTISLAKKAVYRYTSDPKYWFLYDQVAEFFAAMLASDVKQLNSGKTQKIGLGAKRCPSLDKSSDRYTDTIDMVVGV
jgi:translation initiation factor 2 beta subunit (eIF-2beta)/eIF-5